jgi:hypothetical protein
MIFPKLGSSLGLLIVFNDPEPMHVAVRLASLLQIRSYDLTFARIDVPLVFWRFMCTIRPTSQTPICRDLSEG